MHKQLLTSVAMLGLCLHAQSADVVRDLLLGLPSKPIGAMPVGEGAITVGRELFSDTELSVNVKVWRATCHNPRTEFSDAVPTRSGPLMIRLHL
jgi:cytochrome c peroxidase